MDTVSLTERDQLIRQYLRCQPMLEEFIGSLVRSGSDAQDVCQDVALTILEKNVQPPEDPSRFPAWCRGVARNHILHYWRSQRRARIKPSERFVELAEQAFAEADEETEVWNQRRQNLNQCLDNLPENSRNLLSLRFVDDLSTQKI